MHDKRNIDHKLHDELRKIRIVLEQLALKHADDYGRTQELEKLRRLYADPQDDPLCASSKDAITS